jgi:hypothetical protein
MLAANLPPVGSGCNQGDSTESPARHHHRSDSARLATRSRKTLRHEECGIAYGGGDHQQIVRLFHTRITPGIGQWVNEALNLEARARTCKPTQRLALAQKWSVGYLWRTHDFDSCMNFD